MSSKSYHYSPRSLYPSALYSRPDNQIGLALYEDLKQRIPREECKQIYDLVKREALAIDPKIDIEIMGSYRRGAENSGDVDFLITRNDEDGLDHSGVIEKLVRKLMFMGVITHEVSLLPSSHMLGSVELERC
jgi:DNA polymerase lambda